MSLYVTKLLIEILVSHKKLGVCFFFVSDTGDAIDTKIWKRYLTPWKNHWCIVAPRCTFKNRRRDALANSVASLVTLAAAQKRKIEKKSVIAINHLARQALNILAEDFLTLAASQSETGIPSATPKLWPIPSRCTMIDDRWNYRLSPTPRSFLFFSSVSPFPTFVFSFSFTLLASFSRCNYSRQDEIGEIIASVYSKRMQITAMVKY